MDFFKELEKKVFKYGKKYAECPKKAALHLLAWNVRSLFKQWNVVDKKQLSELNQTVDPFPGVLFNLQGGLGDIIIALNFLLQLKNKFKEKLIFYVIVPEELGEAATFLVKNNESIKLFDDYVVNKNWLAQIDLCRIPHIKFVDWENITKISPSFYHWLNDVHDFNQKYPDFLKPGTVSDFILTQFTQRVGRNRLSQADVTNFVNVKTVYKLNVQNENQVMTKYGLIKNTYITLQCGTGIFSKNNFSTREWPIKNYNSLIHILKKYYPTVKIIQLGNKKDLRMDVDLDLCGVTTFNEFLVVLKNSMLHIGGESGCIHMRHFMGYGKSAVLFGPTNKDFYGYPENLNISSKICPGCEWLYPSWQTYCCVSGKTAKCMIKLTPEFVFEQLETILKNKGKLI